MLKTRIVAIQHNRLKKGRILLPNSFWIKSTQLNRCKFVDFFLVFIDDFELGNSIRPFMGQSKNVS